MINVLIVEDDPMVAAINKKYVETIEGFTVVGVAKDELYALEILNSQVVDLAIVDIYLPRGDGIGLLNKIRDKNIKCDVIMVTAASETEKIEKVLRLGAVDYLIKPFEYDRLKTTLENYRERFSLLKASDSISQRELDQVFSLKKEEGEIPKGLNERTLKRILKFIDKYRDDVLNVEEISEGLSLSKVTVRRYMDYLDREGYIIKELEYGSVGRPSYIYRRGER